jgi:hypothetical protein
MVLASPRSWLALLLAALAGACQGPRVADPGAVVRAYSAAAQAGDSDAIYGLLSQRSRRDLGRAGTRQLVLDARKELQSQGRFLSTPDAKAEAIAVIRYDDGERADLELEGGVFRVSSAAALPASARTPAEALGGLRQALARRSYAALVRLMSAETRSALEANLNGLVEGLEDPETLDVDVQGDAAEVGVPGGHVVKLKREAGAWHIEDFK